MRSTHTGHSAFAARAFKDTHRCTNLHAFRHPYRRRASRRPSRRRAASLPGERGRPHVAGKPSAQLSGLSMLQWFHRQCAKLRCSGEAGQHQSFVARFQLATAAIELAWFGPSSSATSATLNDDVHHRSCASRLCVRKCTFSDSHKQCAQADPCRRHAACTCACLGHANGALV